MRKVIVDTFAVLAVAFIGFPILFIFFPSAINPTVYHVVLSFGIGLLFSYLYKKYEPDFKGYLMKATFLSVFLSIMSSAYAISISILLHIGKILNYITMDTVTEISLIDTSRIVNPYVGFVISISFFNLPFFYNYLRMPDRKINLFWWYITPVLGYIYIPYLIFSGYPIIQILNLSSLTYHISFALYSLALGFVILKVMNSFDMRTYKYALAATIISLSSALLSLSYFFMKGFDKVVSQLLTGFSMDTTNITYILPIETMPNPIIAITLFILLFNLPFVEYIYKNQKNWLMLLLLPVLYYVLTIPMEKLGASVAVHFLGIS